MYLKEQLCSRESNTTTAEASTSLQLLGSVLRVERAVNCGGLASRLPEPLSPPAYSWWVALDWMEQPQTWLLSWIKAFLMMSVASREDPGVVHENGGNNQP